MNANSQTWISRRQAIVWCAIVAVVLLVSLTVFFGRGRGEQSWKAADSALVEESELDLSADTNLVRDLPKPKFKTTKIKVDRKPKSIPVSRNFLDEEVKRPE
ncbi:MAG: hypothetical protein K2L96_04235 [Muribaculaceae bacterium]|nr:hypothetical protein [Muribaculaceae bacterium]